MGVKGIHLRRARRRAKLTQAALARRIGKPQSFISKLENGDIADPGIGIVKDLGAILGVDPLLLRFGARPTEGAAA